MAHIPIPIGLCQCGCGAATALSRQKDAARGYVKGRPVRFIPGHNAGRPTYVVDAQTGCWNWTGTRSGKDRRAGSIRVNGLQVSAYVAFYEGAKGPIPAGYVLDHVCGNAGCVNPDHLEVVTQATNVRRRRGVKLTVADAAEIRSWKGRITYVAAAAKFGVSESLINGIWNGRKWRDDAAPHIRGMR